jgi:hypothetical protein
VFQITAGYEDANDSNALRHDPIFKLMLNRLPQSGPALARLSYLRIRILH